MPQILYSLQNKLKTVSKAVTRQQQKKGFLSNLVSITARCRGHLSPMMEQ